MLGSSGCQPGFCCSELGQINWNFPCLVSSLRMRLLGWNGGSLCCSPLPSKPDPPVAPVVGRGPRWYGPSLSQPHCSLRTRTLDDERDRPVLTDFYEWTVNSSLLNEGESWSLPPQSSPSSSVFQNEFESLVTNVRSPCSLWWVFNSFILLHFSHFNGD